MAKGRRKSPSSGAASSPGIAAVLLAAGASRRLGECKALVDLDGQTPLVRLARGVLQLDSKAPAAVVVVGPHGDLIAEQLPTGCELLRNPNAEDGRTGGLRLAISKRPGWDIAIVPVDVPRVPAELFRALGEAWRAEGAPAMGWLAPRYEGRFGHPIVLGRSLAARLTRFPADRPLSELRAEASPLLTLACDCPEILEDLDTPGDLANLRGLLAESEGAPERDSK